MGLVLERHKIYGGVARILFDTKTQTPVMRKIDAVLADAKAARGVKYVGNPTDIYPESHTLLHILVGNDENGNEYQFTGLDVASKYVGERLWDLYYSEMIKNLREMFGGSPNEISRHLFELYGHRIISRGDRVLRCKDLETGSIFNFPLDPLDGTRLSFGRNSIPTTLTKGYFEPSDDDTFPAIDSFTHQGMFQFTVASSHPIKGVDILKKISKLYSDPKIYLVVPPNRFDKFSSQIFLQKGEKKAKGIPSLKQYVLELPVN
jgi:DNA-binding transcriptional ArsR family regulator